MGAINSAAVLHLAACAWCVRAAPSLCSLHLEFWLLIHTSGGGECGSIFRRWSYIGVFVLRLSLICHLNFNLDSTAVTLLRGRIT